MNGKEWREEDKKLFEKLKQDAINENWVYDFETFREDVRRFHEKIKDAWQIHDLIETRIHINTKSDSLGDINKGFDKHPFWSWEHVKDGLVKSYYATERYPVR